jgi:hypothetical protein
MKTFIKCSSVLRIGFIHWSIKKRRILLNHVIDEHIKVNTPYESIETCFI